MNLLLAVSGGIAVYKSCTLVSLALKAGHRVRVMMTTNAKRFVGPVTFQALSGEPVLWDCFQTESGVIEHIDWAKWADLAVVAPATANILGKLAVGLADDGVTTVLMALPRGVPVLLAPAMNTEMWHNPVVQRNIDWLHDLGRYRLVGPVSKKLACGDVGLGAMAEPDEILARIEAMGEASGGAPRG